MCTSWCPLVPKKLPYTLVKKNVCCILQYNIKSVFGISPLVIPGKVRVTKSRWNEIQINWFCCCICYDFSCYVKFFGLHSKSAVESLKIPSGLRKKIYLRKVIFCFEIVIPLIKTIFLNQLHSVSKLLPLLKVLNISRKLH